jgi:hypothetical protein
MRPDTKRRLLIAAVTAFCGLQPCGTHADTVRLNIVPNAKGLGTWVVYLDDKTGDPGVINTGNLGIATYCISVVGTQCVNVTSSFFDAPDNVYSYLVGTKTCTNGVSGFNLENSNGYGDTGKGGDGVGIYATQNSAQAGNANFSYTGFGIANGSDATVPSTHPAISGYSPDFGGVSWTQTSLGVDIASGTYSGLTGELDVFGDDQRLLPDRTRTTFLPLRSSELAGPRETTSLSLPQLPMWLWFPSRHV